MSPRHEGRRWGSWADRAVGLVLGLLLGVGIVTAFVFLGSEKTIDAPEISGLDTAEDPPDSASAGGPLSERIPTVRVRGGAPPAAGPARLEFRRGRTARFRVLSDAPVTIEVPGYRIAEMVESAKVISFRADRTGQFPVIVSGSAIGIAALRVRK